MGQNATARRPEDYFSSEKELQNYRWWFHDLDANCDGHLNSAEQLSWARSIQQSIGVPAARVSSVPADADFDAFLSAAWTLAEEGATVSAFFAQHLAPVQVACPAQAADCQGTCECVRDVLSARTGSIEAIATGHF